MAADENGENKMKKGLIIFIGTLIGFFIPAIFVSYVNWDIAFITTMGSWSEWSRIVMAFITLFTSYIGAFAAYLVINT